LRPLNYKTLWKRKSAGKSLKERGLDKQKKKKIWGKAKGGKRKGRALGKTGEGRDAVGFSGETEGQGQVTVMAWGIGKENALHPGGLTKLKK